MTIDRKVDDILSKIYTAPGYVVLNEEVSEFISVSDLPYLKKYMQQKGLIEFSPEGFLGGTEQHLRYSNDFLRVTGLGVAIAADGGWVKYIENEKAEKELKRKRMELENKLLTRHIRNQSVLFIIIGMFLQFLFDWLRKLI